MIIFYTVFVLYIISTSGLCENWLINSLKFIYDDWWKFNVSIGGWISKYISLYYNNPQIITSGVGTQHFFGIFTKVWKKLKSKNTLLLFFSQ